MFPVTWRSVYFSSVPGLSTAEETKAVMNELFNSLSSDLESAVVNPSPSRLQQTVAGTAWVFCFHMSKHLQLAISRLSVLLQRWIQTGADGDVKSRIGPACPNMQNLMYFHWERVIMCCFRHPGLCKHAVADETDWCYSTHEMLSIRYELLTFMCLFTRAFGQQVWGLIGQMCLLSAHERSASQLGNISTTLTNVFLSYINVRTTRSLSTVYGMFL